MSLTGPNPDDIVCPTCGYYCLGNGGIFCIEKPSLAANETEDLAVDYDRLRAVNAELVAALRRCLSHFERVRAEQVDRNYDSPMMAQARTALAKAGQ